MFCYQCEETAKGTGCSVSGVCGKKPDVAALQDLLTYALQGLAIVAEETRKTSALKPEIKEFMIKALFSTVTNVNFDPQRFVEWINQTITYREELKAAANLSLPIGSATVTIAGSLDEMVKQGEELNLFECPEDENPDIFSLKSILLIGLRGVAAYADHAQILGKKDDSVSDFICEALAVSTRKDLNLDDAVAIGLKCGEVNLRVLELLDDGNTSTYGHPAPTPISLGTKAGKAILVSGHDLYDLEILLKQTEGKGINIYTHGEMLPAHGYPELKKYSHLAGHYGSAWHNQQKEFAAFPGAILMTTNCIQKPSEDYIENIYTTGNVGWPDVKHIDGDDYTPLINKALELDGFTQDTNGKTFTTGFAHNAVLGVAETVIGAVKEGSLKHFFLVGGCDGHKVDRNYFTDFVEKVPQDCVVLTLGCGKFKFFDQDLGDIGGIPRLLDMGQCNDAYSAIQVAVDLAGAFECGVNDLPLSLVISWYEQKAVCILLTLLHLGIKDIRLGPSLPAFITPNVLNVLVENFEIKPVSTPEADLKAILG